jgi:lipoate-protein ligase A
VIFAKLNLWLDWKARDGPEAMAVDEWLLETADVPVLRVYSWSGDWGSLGYFGKLAEAREVLDGVKWVRRWTGGGMVDHREDWTYSLVIPAGEAFSRLRGAESYRMLHAALARVLAGEGIDVRLSTGTDETGAALCFQNPVSHDLVSATGRKMAGAGQRRTRMGLLHQGSVAARCDAASSRTRAEALASALCPDWTHLEMAPPVRVIAEKVGNRYAMESWLARR